MKKVKKVMYWLVGEKAGRTIVGIWNWGWGIPIDSGGKIAVAVAEESLQSMQEGVQRLAEAVATQDASYQRAKQKYDTKLQEIKVLNRQVLNAQKLGHDLAARQTMARIIQIEQILPTLEAMLQQAEDSVKLSKAKLSREREKIESYKSAMQNLKDLAEVNEALVEIGKVNSEFDIGSAKSQFDAAKSAVENRNLRANALNSLSEDPQAAINEEIEQMTLDEEVSLRLQQLESNDITKTD
jgi:phage shock protein A